MCPADGFDSHITHSTTQPQHELGVTKKLVGPTNPTHPPTPLKLVRPFQATENLFLFAGK
jgi:hypothetical protein